MPTYCSTNMQDNRILETCLSKQRSQGERPNTSESYLFSEFNTHNRPRLLFLRSVIQLLQITLMPGQR